MTSETLNLHILAQLCSNLRHSRLKLVLISLQGVGQAQISASFVEPLVRVVLAGFLGNCGSLVESHQRRMTKTSLFEKQQSSYNTTRPQEVVSSVFWWLNLVRLYSLYNIYNPIPQKEDIILLYSG